MQMNWMPGSKLNFLMSMMIALNSPNLTYLLKLQPHSEY